MARWNCLMIAVADLDRSASRLLAKASQLARRVGASLHVVHIFSHPHLPSGKRRAERIGAVVEPLQAQLDRLVQRLRRSGVPVTAAVVWDYPAGDALVRQVLEHRPDMLIIQAAPRNRVERWLLTNTDWELIRECPCPLWISRSASLPARPTVMAAVDPSHAHAKSARLDKEIVSAAGDFADALQGRLGICYVYPLPFTAVPVPGTPVVVPLTAQEERELRSKAEGAVERLLGARQVMRKDRTLVPGEPGQLLPAIAKRWRANVFVMGAVSRSGLKRAFIGNTAERILDTLDCDVLVVKPRSFKTRVRSAP
jgi:universal stress protein E